MQLPCAVKSQGPDIRFRRAIGPEHQDPIMPLSAHEIKEFDWTRLDDANGYAAWRTDRLARAAAANGASPVRIADLANPSDAEKEALVGRCRAQNFAHYASDADAAAGDATRRRLRGFAAAMGLEIAERHRSADGDGIVALAVSDAPDKRGYIPYSARPMNWHTDGYYNAPSDYVAGFVLHCARPAADGGGNELLDPEIAYIRLRDRDPAFIAALMDRRAMSIPENREADGSIRPESVGPVFFADPGTGRLQMRYTARTRSIAWRDAPATRAAEAALREILAGDDPLIRRLSLKAGEGILNNNVLHNRTGFGAQAGRLIYRVRFTNRVRGS